MPKKNINKDTIVAKSLGVFLAKGYYNTSFSDLATTCGIEKSHFYYYFKSKQDLMNHCLVAFTEKVEENVFTISRDNNLPVGERLKKMLEFVWKLYENSEHGCLFGNTLLETVGKEAFFNAAITDFFDRWKIALSLLYSTKITGPQVEHIALADIEKIQGSIMLMRLYNDKKILRRAIDSVLAQFERL